ncbi:CIH_HP2_G0016430.mRNA.1.CDS.1 [Saccharomyces cerevisiae]|nr:CIH_HP2_G0016430.mRNA.1.CDS.1 [Saccharomyces cerevisiae]CAI6540273.1 CIH_HP2_G0016430.mRNA.1.CDS.1 [Saccharomyces cerevisiae]
MVLWAKMVLVNLLVRALSRRDLNVPKHGFDFGTWEQELRGDDTKALQSVLDADVWRKQLLSEEAKINERLKGNGCIKTGIRRRQFRSKKLDNEREDLDNHLIQISDKLVDMELTRLKVRSINLIWFRVHSKRHRNNPLIPFRWLENEIVLGQRASYSVN